LKSGVAFQASVQSKLTGPGQPRTPANEAKQTATMSDEASRENARLIVARLREGFFVVRQSWVGRGVELYVCVVGFEKVKAEADEID